MKTCTLILLSIWLSLWERWLRGISGLLFTGSVPFFQSTIQSNNYSVKSIRIRSFSCSAFSCICAEYGDSLCNFPYSLWIQGNTDQKKLRLRTFFTRFNIMFRRFQMFELQELITIFLTAGPTLIFFPLKNIVPCDKTFCTSSWLVKVTKPNLVII